jgi:general stress protein 26
MTKQDLSKAMAKIDFTMLTTRTESGELATRPMSNNGDVEWNGDSFADIGRDPKVALSFQGSGHLLGKPPLFIAIEGHATLIRDKAQFSAHWHESLDRWFSEGVETAGLILIQVHAHRAHYWDGEEENEVRL